MVVKKVDFSSGSITGNIIKTAAPMLVAQILNLLYSIVDRIYIARIPDIGTAAIGAVGLCFPVITIIAAFTNLFGSGGSPLFAMARGRRDREEASLTMNLSYTMLIISGIILMVIGEVFARPILIAFGASESALTHALPYMRIYLLGTVFSLIATGMNPFINAQGFSVVGMLTVMIGAVSNIILDPIFIFVLGMGVSGAAVATVISQVVSAVFVIRFLTGERTEYRAIVLSFKAVKCNLSTLGSITALGLVTFIMQITNSMVQVCCNNVLMTHGGDVYVSVMTIVNSIRQILDTPIGAVSDGTTPILSYNYGAGNYRRVRKTALVMTIIMFVYSVIFWRLIETFPKVFISIFSNDETILGDTIPALHLYFYAFIFQTFQITGQTMFKALNKKKRAIFFSLFRKVIIVVPLTLLLPGVFGFGTDGVFMAEPISNVVGGLACFVTMLLTLMPELRKGKTGDV